MRLKLRVILRIRLKLTMILRMILRMRVRMILRVRVSKLRAGVIEVAVPTLPVGGVYSHNDQTTNKPTIWSTN